MDVAKHISLFLLKNKYCQLQGLGNLELRRTTAVNSGNTLSGGAYKVNWNAAGGIDDQLPLFIAMQESVSSSRAATALNEFVTASKAQLQSGQSVVLPGIGSFRMYEGQMSFQTDEHFSLPEGNIPLSYFNRKPDPEEQAPIADAASADAVADAYAQYNNYNAAPPTNWARIGFWGVGILVVLSIVAGILRYTVWDNSAPVTVPVNVNSNDIRIDSVATASAPPVDSSVITDSAAAKDSLALAATPAPSTAAAPVSFRFILKKYKHLEAAEKRVKKLSGYGHPVKVVSINDSLHYVVEELQIAAADTTRIKDSLTRWLSPEGVEIMK
jgi:nucleoid DNA-binding protein